MFVVPVTLGVSVTIAPRKMLGLGDATLTEIVGGGAGVATEPTVPQPHPSVDIAASSTVPNFFRQPWFLRPTVLAGTSPMPRGESKPPASAGHALRCASGRCRAVRTRTDSRDNPQDFSQLRSSAAALKRGRCSGNEFKLAAKSHAILILTRAHVPNWLSGVARHARVAD